VCDFLARHKVTALARRLRTVLEDHPGIAALLQTRDPVSPASLALAEAFLAPLQAAGLPGRQAALAFRLIYDYTLGFALSDRTSPGEQRVQDSATRAELHAFLRSLPASRFPHSPPSAHTPGPTTATSGSPPASTPSSPTCRQPSTPAPATPPGQLKPDPPGQLAQTAGREHPRRPGDRHDGGAALFVTATGDTQRRCGGPGRPMAGRYRLPDALRRADAFARAGLPAVSMTDRQPR
jgi:Tetracyclin repressor-like, C-terminal domain